MLERASSCLEPAAQNLFRSIEAPTRSQRRLPQAFWRYASRTQEHISWWPAYLDDIRRAAQAREGALGISISTSPAVRQLPFATNSWITAENQTASTAGSRRNISKVVKQSRVRKDKEFQGTLEDLNETYQPVEVEIFGPDGIPELLDARPDAEKTPSERLEELLRTGGEPQYNAVYLTFVSLREPARLARAVLRYLSRSPSTVILRRALRIFQIIEVDDRTHLTYDSAVRAAVGLRRYSTASAFVLEALERGLGHECSQFLMSHLVEKGMWKSAVRSLHVFNEHTRPLGSERGISNEHVARNIREAPVWKTVDRMLTLPRKLLALCVQLKDGDAVLASSRPDIEDLATRLLERALRSTTIMAAITPEGVLALFDSYRGLGLLKPDHFLDALSSLRAMREFRNRSQLALLIFRNMRWQYPLLRIRDSTYGTLISILSAAPNEPDAFEYVIQDIIAVPRGTKATASRRKLDLAMYQRVMSACAEQGHTTYVNDLFHKLIDDHGVPRDLAYFTPVLLSSAKRGDVSTTKRSFNELSSKYDMKPDIWCWNILLLAYARADDFEGAAALFRQMQSLDPPADSYTFGTLMSMCSNAGDTQSVLQLVNMAKKQHIPASTAMIDMIVHTYCLNGEVKEAESLVEAATHMSLSGAPTRMWNTLLRHYAFKGDSASVLRTQERMREHRVKPDGMTYAALMTSLVVLGKTKDAAAVLRSLHLSQVVTASRFHYSIVIHGYVMEGNRDMATVIYTEMLERFSRPSPSARLAIMHLQSRRDDQQTQSTNAAVALEWTGKPWLSTGPLQTHSIEFLADALLEMADTEALSAEPQPGFQRRRPTLVTPAIYLEVSVAVLNNESSYDKARRLLSKYNAVMDASNMSKQQKSYQTVQILTAHMRGVIRSFEGSGSFTAHLGKQAQGRLDAIWSKILDQTISTARGHRLGLIKSSDDNDSDVAVSSQPTMETPHEKGPSFDPATVGVTAKPFDNDGILLSNHPPVDVLPAKRYALSVPLSVYMRGLALQIRLPELVRLVQQVQDFGFELTSKNWNTYIQVLSEGRDHVLQAFIVFEQKMLPNLPPWALLKRGLAWPAPDDKLSLKESEEPELEKSPVFRPTIERRHPGQLVPTYFTVIHLAAAFIKAYRKQHVGESDGSTLYSELRKYAPGTVKFIQTMPHLKDRVQGVLVRGRAVKGDLMKRPRKAERADRAGLLGSQSMLDGISHEQMEVLKNSESTKEDLRALYEEIEGPIVQSALVTSRDEQLEPHEMYEQHIPSQKKQNSHIQQLRQELQDKKPSIMADDVHGEPYFEGLPAQDKAVPSPNSLFKSRVESLRALAETREIQYPRWRFRSQFKQTPRIKAYVSKQPRQLLKPMGNYKHKSPLFTKPMLTKSIPKRRQVGRERVAFSGWKAYMELRKEREYESRRAQARNRRMRRQEKRQNQENIADKSLERVDEPRFLQSRTIRYQQEDHGKSSEVDGRQERGNFPIHDEAVSTDASGPERTHTLSPGSSLPAKTDRVTEADDDDHVGFLEAKLVGPELPQQSGSAGAKTYPDRRRKTPPREERTDMPFGPVEGFDEFVPAAPRKKSSSEYVNKTSG